MNYLLFLVMLLFLIYGILTLFSPEKEKKIILAYTKRVSQKNQGLIEIVLAILVWFSSGSITTAGNFFIKFLALLFLTGGLSLVFVSREKFNKLIDWWIAAPSFAVRIFGAFSLIVGFFIFRLII